MRNHCSPGTEGTFVVQVPKTASVGAVKEAVSKTFVLVLGPAGPSTNTGHRRGTIRLFVAGREDPLSDAAAIAERMAQEGAPEVSMLLQECKSETGWMVDADIGGWHGATVNAQGRSSSRWR